MRRTPLPVVVLCMTLAGIAACGDDDDSGQSDLCDAKASLETSVQDLRNVDIRENGMSELEAAVDDVQSSADALVDAASGAVESQTQTLRADLSTLANAISEVRSNGLAPVTDAAAAVEDSAAALVEQLESENCPS